MTLEDDAVFQCQVAGIGGARGLRSQSAKLTVYVPPEHPKILQGDVSFFFIEIDFLLKEMLL